MTDAEFEAYCRENGNVQIERTSEGAIRVNPPTGWDTSSANLEISGRLFAWWIKHQRGIVTDSSGGFYLPDSSILSPDAAYVTPKTRKQIPRERKTAYFPGCPDFVIELLSRSDPLAEIQDKMERWIANGAQLGWLIDPYQKKVFIYQPGLDVISFTGDILEGHGPVSGFNLDLVRIWRYYED